MSYARWSNGDWYIYWEASSGDTRNSQRLAVWHVTDSKNPLYNYYELKENRELVWADISTRCTPTQREDFDECIDAFLEEVEIEYA